MVPADVSPDGFEVPARELPARAVVPDRNRAQGIRVLAAITLGATPEEISQWREEGWPERVEELAVSPMHQEEFSRHLDHVADVLEYRQMRAAAA